MPLLPLSKSGRLDTALPYPPRHQHLGQLHSYLAQQQRKLGNACFFHQKRRKTDSSDETCTIPGGEPVAAVAGLQRPLVPLTSPNLG